MIRFRDRQFVGLNDDPGAPLAEGWVSRAQNVYLAGQRYIGRPGLEYYGRPANAQVRAGFAWFQDGVYKEIAVCNARVYYRNVATDGVEAWALLTGHNTIDASKNPDIAFYNNTLVFTDGTNRPWTWNGSTSAPVYVTLTNAPISSGVATYYGKLFFYSLATGNPYRFEWSEEFQPNVGYADVAYNNFWEFATGDDSGPVVKLLGFDGFLLVLKRDSITQVPGSVEKDFKSSQRSSVSSTTGCVSRRAVVVKDQDVFFLSQEGPRLLLGGQQLVDIEDRKVRTFWEGVDQQNLSRAVAAYVPSLKLVLFGVPRTGETLDTGLFGAGSIQSALAYRMPESAQPGSWSTMIFPGAGFESMWSSRQPKSTHAGNSTYATGYGRPYVLIGGGAGGGVWRLGFEDDFHSDYLALQTEILVGTTALNGASWTASQCVVNPASEVNDPTGGTGAWKITPNGAATDAHLVQSVADTRLGQFSGAIWVRTPAGTSTTLWGPPVLDDNLAGWTQYPLAQTVVTDKWQRLTCTAQFSRAHTVKRFVIGGFGGYTGPDQPLYVYAPAMRFDLLTGKPIERALHTRSYGQELPDTSFAFTRAHVSMLMPTDVNIGTEPLPNGVARGAYRERPLVRRSGWHRYTRGLSVKAQCCGLAITQNARDQNFELAGVVLEALEVGSYPIPLRGGTP